MPTIQRSARLVTLQLLFASVCSLAVLGEDISLVTPETVGLSSAKLAEVDSAVQQLVKDKKIPGGVILVARKGRIAYLKSFGKKDLASDAPMTADTIFRIYSMSKAITSAAAMMLVDEGKLDLDDPISKHIPEFVDVKIHSESGSTRPTRPPTVRDLLRHTAGLTYGIFGNSPVDQQYRAAGILSPADSVEVMAAKVGKLPLEYDPGTSWKYSVSSDVLGRVVEVASGQKFGNFLQERIFTPLGMADTGFHVPDSKLSRFSTNYNSNGSGILTPIDVPVSSTYRKKKTFESGGGGLVSTIRDYYQFLLMISQGGKIGSTQFLSAESIKLMTTNQVPNTTGWIRFGDEIREGVGFGLGFSVRSKMSDWDSGGRLGEYGWGGAASTHYWVSPKDDLIVITMEQVMPYSFLTEFAVKKLIYDSIESP